MELFTGTVHFNNSFDVLTIPVNIIFFFPVDVPVNNSVLKELLALSMILFTGTVSVTPRRTAEYKG